MSLTRYSSLFKNRWVALTWAAGICWGAVEFTACTDIGSDDMVVAGNASTDADDAADINRLQALVEELKRK